MCKDTTKQIQKKKLLFLPANIIIDDLHKVTNCITHVTTCWNKNATACPDLTFMMGRRKKKTLRKEHQSFS